jgi:general secretion pathway protein J
VRTDQHHGFTLLELLLAVLVFGLLASSAYGVLNSISRASAAQEQAGEQLRVTQLGLLRLGRELRQVIGVSPLDVGSDALTGNTQDLSYSTLVPLPTGGLSEIRRVSYRFSDGNLYRAAGLAVTGTESPGNRHVLIPGLSSVAFAYLDHDGNWRDTWSGTGQWKLPRAVRVQLDIDGLGPVERVVELPGDRR